MATKHSARERLAAELPVVLRSHDPNDSIIPTICQITARAVSTFHRFPSRIPETTSRQATQRTREIVFRFGQRPHFRNFFRRKDRFVLLPENQRNHDDATSTTKIYRVFVEAGRSESQAEEDFLPQRSKRAQRTPCFQHSVSSVISVANHGVVCFSTLQFA